MTSFELLFLILVFFVTSIVGIVTGSNSLITVPVMFQFGIEPRSAVATNMFALVFMAVGGTIPFLRARQLNVDRIWPLLIITAIGSALGALLVGFISDPSMKVIVSVGMIGVGLFILFRTRDKAPDSVGRTLMSVTFIVTFLLGVYGGLFSGGYVTMLTASLVAFFGMRFSEAVASTKLINLVSSSIATAIFMWQGLVDYRLGLILGVTMFVGGYVGAHFATKLSETWLRRIFLSTVFVLAMKTIYDFI